MNSTAHEHPSKKRSGDRSGMSTVEFGLLLPFLAVLASAVFGLGYMVHRSIGESYAAFAAARRCAVGGSTAPAVPYVLADCRACAIVGVPAVTARFAPGEPGIATVTVRDSFPQALPGSRAVPLFRFGTGPSVTVKAAGTTPSMGGDNDR